MTEELKFDEMFPTWAFHVPTKKWIAKRGVLPETARPSGWSGVVSAAEQTGFENWKAQAMAPVSAIANTVVNDGRRLDSLQRSNSIMASESVPSAEEKLEAADDNTDLKYDNVRLEVVLQSGVSTHVLKTGAGSISSKITAGNVADFRAAIYKLVSDKKKIHFSKVEKEGYVGVKWPSSNSVRCPSFVAEELADEDFGETARQFSYVVTDASSELLIPKRGQKPAKRSSVDVEETDTRSKDVNTIALALSKRYKKMLSMEEYYNWTMKISQGIASMETIPDILKHKKAKTESVPVPGVAADSHASSAMFASLQAQNTAMLTSLNGFQTSLMPIMQDTAAVLKETAAALKKLTDNKE